MPLTDTFAPTSARHVVVTGQPDLVFSADTPMGPIWATAYDDYVDGNMEMEARILSAISVMHDFGTPVRDQVSLRRWIREGPASPTALLPEIVERQPISDTQARVVTRLRI